MAKYDKPLDKDDEGTPAKYRLPFALCKERGIELPKWATPRDAWNALKGYNINPNLEYQRLFEKKQREKHKSAENKEKKRQSKDPEHSPDYNYTSKKGYIAGVKQGKPMTFKEADGGAPNPNFKQDVVFGGNLFGYTTNCQTCVVALEARMRGFDVRALPNNRNPYIRDLSHRTNLAYVDANGKNPSYITPKRGERKMSFIERAVGDNGRYTLEFRHKYGYGDGHIVSVFKEKGSIKIYDPQSGEIIKNPKDYLSSKSNLKLLRVDNVDFDPTYVDYILKGV